LHTLGKAKDLTYDSVDLSLFSIAEVAIGMFAASLPPLRKLFERCARAILPTTLIGSSTANKRNGNSNKGGSFPLRTIGSAKPNFEKLGDEGSERGILNDEGEPANHGGIYKNTEVVQAVDKKVGSDTESRVNLNGYYGGIA